MSRDLFDQRPTGEIARDDPLPSGPYSVGLTKSPTGDCWPFTVRCADGRAVAGQINSRACADAIAWALNAQADATGSYNDAVKAVGESVKAGTPVPDFFLSQREGTR